LASKDNFIDFFDLLINESHSLLGDFEHIKIFRNVYMESILSLPGGSPLEKYDMHYLFFRNGLHCSDLFRFGYNDPRVGVIQSINLFKLKYATYGLLPNTLIQNDLLSYLNPVSLVFPYASDRDNFDLDAVRNDLKFLPKSLLLSKLSNLPDASLVEAARSLKKIRKIESNHDDSNDLLDDVEYALGCLVRDAQIINFDFGYELFIELRIGASRHVLANKILMIYFMWRICLK
jgi:hypothetical protein